jgi:hypothetical protein
MAGDGLGEGRLKPAPFLAVLPPQFDLFDNETGIGVEEGEI